MKWTIGTACNWITQELLVLKGYNWSSVYPRDLKFLQELDNFMSYNFGSQFKVIIPENVSPKIQLLLLWFSVFSENIASVFCEYLLLYMSDWAEIWWEFIWWNLEQHWYPTHDLIRKGSKDKNSDKLLHSAFRSLPTVYISSIRGSLHPSSSRFYLRLLPHQY